MTQAEQPSQAFIGAEGYILVKDIHQPVDNKLGERAQFSCPDLP
jgi:hypothetical protein